MYGSVPREAILPKGGMQPGQAVILTKAIGTGEQRCSWQHRCSCSSMQRLISPLPEWSMRPEVAIFLAAGASTGTILVAEMRGGGKGRWLEAAVAGMTQSNGPAVPVLRSHGVTACTDVTGFGLLGHLAEMARASKVRMISVCQTAWLSCCSRC